MGQISAAQNAAKITFSNSLQQGETVNELELDKIAGGNIEGIFPAVYDSSANQIDIQCPAAGTELLKDYLKGIVVKAGFLDIVAQVIEIVKSCERNRLDIHNLYLDTESIVIDRQTKKIRCILWPVNNNIYSRSPFLFLSDLPYRLVFSKYEDNTYITAYIKFFRGSPSFTISNIETFLQRLSGNVTALTSGSLSDSKVIYSDGTVDTAPSITYEDPSEVTTSKIDPDLRTMHSGILLQPGEQHYFPYLIRTRTLDQIIVNKPVFRLGKDRRFCDYSITDNGAVSRNHADIIKRDGNYYLLDHNSTNKTYIDGKSIPVETEVEILSGSKIKLANEEFMFFT